MRIFLSYGRSLDRGDADVSTGGTSTALLGLSHALSRRGHDVHIFARCRNPGLSNSVEFHDRLHLAPVAEMQSPDALIVIPPLLPLIMPIRARARLSWLHDSYPTGGCALTVNWTWSEDIGRSGTVVRLYSMALLHHYVDTVVVGSRWHAMDVSHDAAIPPRKFSVIYLGIPREHYEHDSTPHHSRRLVYTSRSERGLDILLRLFPRMRRSVPNLELHIFGYEYGDDDSMPQFAGLTEPGVHFHGAVKKSMLAGELRSSTLMAYPCTFPETFCISVAEAQAAGLAVVTTDFGAISERISPGVDGVLLPPPAESKEYAEQFVESVVTLLQDDRLRKQMGKEAMKKAGRDYNWDVIASQWEEVLERATADSEPQLPHVDPTLDLLEPSLLEVSAREHTAQIPAELAEKWLRKQWRAYGFDSNSIPGLPKRRPAVNPRQYL